MTERTLLASPEILRRETILERLRLEQFDISDNLFAKRPENDENTTYFTLLPPEGIVTGTHALCIPSSKESEFEQLVRNAISNSGYRGYILGGIAGASGAYMYDSLYSDSVTVGMGAIFMIGVACGAISEHILHSNSRQKSRDRLSKEFHPLYWSEKPYDLDVLYEFFNSIHDTNLIK